MIGTDVSLAKKLLKSGQVVAIPTETVYGLAGNALNEEAVASIFKVKNRPTFDPLIVHLKDFKSAEQYCLFIPEFMQKLADQFMPGPLTLLLPKAEIIPDLVTAGSSLVALRIPSHPITSKLLQQLDFPLAAPSANPFGYISPTNAQHVNDQLGNKIPYILDGGACQIGLESTIIGFEDNLPVIHRKGGISIEAIEAIVGPIKVNAHSSSNPKAPGMLKSHYAPTAPLVVGHLQTLISTHRNKNIGIISFQKNYDEIPQQNQVILSHSGDFKEAARNLFAGMRQLDALKLDLILAELLPELGLGRAINDRLRRAAA